MLSPIFLEILRVNDHYWRDKLDYVLRCHVLSTMVLLFPKNYSPVKLECCTNSIFCLLFLFSVPGMPNGEKGSNYRAFNDYLYRFYSVNFIKRKRKCPQTTPAPTQTKSSK